MNFSQAYYTVIERWDCSYSSVLHNKNKVSIGINILLIDLGNRIIIVIFTSTFIQSSDIVLHVWMIDIQKGLIGYFTFLHNFYIFYIIKLIGYPWKENVEYKQSKHVSLLFLQNHWFASRKLHASLPYFRLKLCLFRFWRNLFLSTFFLLFFGKAITLFTTFFMLWIFTLLSTCEKSVYFFNLFWNSFRNPRVLKCFFGRISSCRIPNKYFW